MAIGNTRAERMNGGLELHGSRPGSAEPPSSFNQTYQVNQTPARKSRSQYQDRLFSGPGTSTYTSKDPGLPMNKTYNRSKSDSNVPPSPKSGAPRPSTPQRGAIPTKPSYIDESLFGDKPMEPDFTAPWDDGKKPVFVMDATDYKMQNKLREQRERNTREQKDKKKNSPMVVSHTIVKTPNRSNRPKSGKPKYRPSEVDELLFGSEKDRAKLAGVSWEARSSPSHDPLNTGRFSVIGSRPPSREGRPQSPGRPLSGRPSSPANRPGSAFGKTKTLYSKHNPSYVDESLFGPKPMEPDFPAPWENAAEDRKRGSPLLFDGRDHRVVIDHGRPGSSRSSARSRARPRSSSANRTPDKPAPWK